ncbi:MAG: hypothetical protein MJZ64_00275 [Paludibacteraceae bacterium]|nr:hypothetical protein [Paludibacteraceae bacterium]
MKPQKYKRVEYITAIQIADDEETKSAIKEMLGTELEYYEYHKSSGFKYSIKEPSNPNVSCLANDGYYLFMADDNMLRAISPNDFANANFKQVK